jgi:serine/threonine-protein kinase
MAQPAKYKVLQQLGSGGMGTVYKGLVVGQAGFQRPVVIKQLRSPDPGHVGLFVDEARRYALLDHENIGRIFDFEEVGGELCIILEYIDGWSLVEYLDAHRDIGRLPDVDLSVFIVSRVCRALQYVYEKAAIVHRDVSPSNIMMTREGAVKLIDFGIATRSGTRDSSLTGKPSYMAPEMILELRADNRSDVFSLGAVLHEMLTGAKLFRGESTAEILQSVLTAEIPSPRSANGHVTDDVLAIHRRALERAPARRFDSAGEMGEACEHYLYDKGYGPTNLTLKHYVRALFPEAEDDALPDSSLAFPNVEPTLLPITDPKPRPEPPGGATKVTPVSRYTRVLSVRRSVTPDPLTPRAGTAPKRKARASPRRPRGD